MPPVVIAAGIGAAAGIGGGILSASAQKKAAGKAADSAASTAAANNALQREIYGQNQAMLNPYVTRGNEAGSAINALLGISGTTATAQPAQPPPQGTQQYGQPVNSSVANSAAPYSSQQVSERYGNGFLGGVLQQALAQNGQGGVQYQNAPPPVAPPAAPVPAGTVPSGVTPYQNAFQNYLGSTGYQFQVDQGNKAINQGYAAQGSLQSGAAMKALQTYGQNTATGFFKDYLGLLGNQQGVGLVGAQATAGVGSNYANNVSSNNNNASAAAQDRYIANGNATAGIYGNVVGGIKSVANAFGSSYRPASSSGSFSNAIGYGG